MNNLQIIQWAKRLANDPQLDESSLSTEVNPALPIAFWADTENKAQLYFENQILQAAQDFFIGQDTITYTAGTDKYTVPSHMMQLRLLERVETSKKYRLHPVSLVDKNKYLDSNYPYNSVYPYGNNDPRVYYFFGDRIAIADDDESGTMNIFYVRRLPDLHYGTATAAASTTITFDTSPDLGNLISVDDYYNQAFVEIVSASTGVGEIRRITDYVASTRVATITPAWTSTPTGTIVYNVMCEIPKEHHEAVAARMAIIAKISDQLEVPANLQLYAQELENNMIEALIPRHTDESRHINNPYGEF